MKKELKEFTAKKIQGNMKEDSSEGNENPKQSKTYKKNSKMAGVLTLAQSERI